MRDTQTIIGLQVISLAEGRQLGRVGAVVCDLASGRLVGLVLETEPRLGIAATDIKTLGLEAVLVPTDDVAKPLEELPELAQKYGDIARGPADVITDEGRKLGLLGRIFIDPEARTVTRFEVSSGLWRDVTEGVVILPQMAGIMHGADVIIVPAPAEALTTGGIVERLEKAGEKVRVGYQQVAEKAGELVQAARQEISETRTPKAPAAEAGQPSTAGECGEDAAATCPPQSPDEQ